MLANLSINEIVTLLVLFAGMVSGFVAIKVWINVLRRDFVLIATQITSLDAKMTKRIDGMDQKIYDLAKANNGGR